MAKGYVITVKKSKKETDHDKKIFESIRNATPNQKKMIVSMLLKLTI